ncbi:ABC transporter permease [Leucobacter sp. wl10]|uniref:ABC transporter permease n=1 Tax=Leucobacter sp. wl10 TaxID=2304677 RepID=UPI000E5B709B|nr:ABC transporter permease [Leucobacter sp. wl10]RGE22059.1 ABC transporter permease [Leucobacter sp. wl10]
MKAYVLKRAAQAFVVLWLAYTLAFFLLNILPGDAALARMGDTGLAPEQIEQIRISLGLDKPLAVRYGEQIVSLLQGDFGSSYRDRQPVLKVVMAALPKTFAIAVPAILLGLIGGVALAIVANWVKKPWLRNFFNALPSVGVSIPTFWIGILFIMLFAFKLGWSPAFGSSDWRTLILPVIVLAIEPAAVIGQVLSASLGQVMRGPYAFAALCRGNSRLRVVLVHGLKNAFIPTLTITGVLAGGLLTGAVVTETVFNRAGLGRVILESVKNADLPVVQGVVVVAAVIFVIVNLLIDLSYPLLDPRIRQEGRRG